MDTSLAAVQRCGWWSRGCGVWRCGRTTTRATTQRRRIKRSNETKQRGGKKKKEKEKRCGRGENQSCDVEGRKPRRKGKKRNGSEDETKRRCEPTSKKVEEEPNVQHVHERKRVPGDASGSNEPKENHAMEKNHDSKEPIHERTRSKPEGRTKWKLTDGTATKKKNHIYRW